MTTAYELRRSVGQASPAEQPVALHPVDHPGHPAGGQGGLGGEVGHPQLVAGGAGEPEEHLELDRGEAVLLELGGEARSTARV